MTERARFPLPFALVALCSLLALTIGCSDSTKPTPYSPEPATSGGGNVTPPAPVTLSLTSASPSTGSTIPAHTTGSITATFKYDLGASIAAHYQFVVLGVGGTDPTRWNYLEVWEGGAPPEHSGTMNVPVSYFNLPANSTITFYVNLVGNSGTAQVQLKYKTGP